MSINTIQVVAIGIRLFAIALVLYVLQLLGWTLWGESVESLWLAATWMVPWLLAAVLLWFYPKTVASKLVPPVPRQETPSPVTADQVQVIGSALLGLWVLAWSVPDLLGRFLLGALSGTQYDESGLGVWQWGSIATELVRIAIGLWLLLGARGISRVIRKLRDA